MKKDKRRNLLYKELKKIVKILKEKYKPERIILFGSLAESKINVNSDIDLIVIKKTKRNPWTRQRIIEKFLEHNVPVDFLVYTPQEINQRLALGDFFIKEIMEKGKVIYEKGKY